MNDHKEARDKQLESRAKHLRHELYEGTSAQVKKFLLEELDLGLNDKHAEWLGNQLSNFLSDYFAGQTLTFPKDHYYKIDERDFEIFEKVNSRNMMEVAREYNLTRNGLYRVINRIKGRAVTRAGQLDIFNKP